MVSRDLSIVFDLDGTLVDTIQDLRHALNYVLNKIDCPPVETSDMPKVIGHGAKYMILSSLKLSDISVSYNVAEETYQEFLNYYYKHTVISSVPFPGVLPVLNQLKEAGIKLGVCTNKPEALCRKILQELNMLHYFLAIVGGDSLDVKKPDPEHLINTIKCMGGNTQEAVMVGDGIPDINAAKAANIPVIAVSYGYCPIPLNKLSPDVVIDHFEELLKVIRIEEERDDIAEYDGKFLLK